MSADRHGVTSKGGPAPDYVLGHSGSELRRLNTQAALIDPMTRRFAIEAGITTGMRVLDVGSGAGDVAILLADLVGDTGEVVGFDRSAAALDVARGKVSARGLHNVHFVAGTADEVTFDAPFDGIVGRYVLQFQSEPAQMLAAVAAWANPGARVLFHELDWSGAMSQPPAPNFDRLCHWLMAALEQGGASSHMGMRLPEVFATAGLPDPVLRLDGLIGAGAWVTDSLGVICDLAQTLAPVMLASGIVSAETLDVDTLFERLVAEATANRSVITAPINIAAWSRV